MATYITIADVDDLLGSDWSTDPAPGQNAGLAVIMANTWLTAQLGGQYSTPPVPDAIQLAGAEIAREAIHGRLYTAKARTTTETEASAAPGTYVKKKFATEAGSEAQTAGMVFALALLAPWLGPRSGVGRAVIERV